MRYEFPRIDADVCRQIVEDNSEFIRVEKDGYVVYNYVVQSNDTFPEDDPHRREMRGLILCADDKRVISRPFHKFFNMGEREETAEATIDWTQPHTILEKLDGSMIRPIPIGDAYRLGSKMGVGTDVANQAEVWISTRPSYDEFIRFMIDMKWTPIFEWCSRKARIVIDYPQDQLVLTAIRNNETGEYMGYYAMVHIATSRGIQVVAKYDTTLTNLKEMVESGLEGWVVRFDDGHMVKVKLDWYVARHRSKSMLESEKQVWQMIVGNYSDDVKALLSDHDRKQVEEFENEFWKRFAATVRVMEKSIGDSFRLYKTRKEFAINRMSDVTDFERFLTFKAYDGNDIAESAYQYLKKVPSSQAKIDGFKYAVDGLTWEYKHEHT